MFQEIAIDYAYKEIFIFKMTAGFLNTSDNRKYLK